jgi:hypothetical protein
MQRTLYVGMGRGIDGRMPPPTSIVACLWFNALIVGWNTMDSELHATDTIVPLARDFGSWTWSHWSLQRQCDESIALCEVATLVRIHSINDNIFILLFRFVIHD